MTFLQILNYQIKFKLWQFLLLVIASIICVLLLRSHHKSNGSPTLPKLQVTTSYVDKNNIKHETVPEKIVAKKEMKKATKEIRKNIKGKPNITSYAQIVNTLDTVLPDVAIIMTDDSIYAQDSTKYINVIFGGSTKTKIGVFSIHLEPDTITLVNTEKRHLFSGKSHSLDLTHSNQLITTSLASSMTYKEKKSIICFGPSLGVRLGLESTKITYHPYIGVGVTFNLISLKR